MTNIEYRQIAPADYEAVRRFLSDLGWRERISDLARFVQMMERADRTVVAWEGESVIGFARALCDDVSNGYISMLAVAPHQRGQGIGREIVRRLTEGAATVTWVLRAGHESAGFWQKLGFVQSAIAMERKRSQ